MQPVRTVSAADAARNYWALVAIILLGTVLRFWRLDFQSLWFDESFSAAIATNLTSGQIVTNAGQSVHPPLYYLLLHFWTHLLGNSEYALRLPSALLSMLAIPLLYQLGRSWFDARAGTIAALIFALTPFQIQFAQETRMYTLLLLFTLLSMAAFSRAVKSGRWGWWVIYLLAVVGGIYTHYFMAFVALVYHLFLLLHPKRYRSAWLSMLLIDGLVFVALFPQLLIFFNRQAQVVFGGDYWLGAPPVIYLFLTPYFLLVGNYSLSIGLIYGGIFCTLALLLIATYQVLRNIFPIYNRDWQQLLLLGMYLPLVTAFLISQYKPIYLTRTFIICTPFLTLLMALTLSRAILKSPVPYAAAVMIILLGATLYSSHIDPQPFKQSIREIATDIAQHQTEQDIFVHTSQWTALPFAYYIGSAQTYWLADTPNPILPPDRWELLHGQSITLHSVPPPRRIWVITEIDHTDETAIDRLRQLGDNRPILWQQDSGSQSITLYGRVSSATATTNINPDVNE